MSDANIGGRIKKISSVLWWINVVIVIIAVLVVSVVAGFTLYNSGAVILAIIGAVLVGLLEIFLSYFYFLLIRGFGHLVDKTNDLSDRSASIEKKVEDLSKKLENFDKPAKPEPAKQTTPEVIS